MSEAELLDLIDNSKRVFLLEPGYERAYPPLGLMKIASRVRRRGGKVKFARAYLGEKCDLICTTSLFTYQSGDVIRAVRQAEELSKGTPVVVGGIYASLMPQHLVKHTNSARVFVGYSEALDQSVPDYSIDWRVENPVFQDCSFVFTTRGCRNTCAYCAVPRIEPGMWINPTWREHIKHDNVILIDNNPLSMPAPHLDAVLDFLMAEKKAVMSDGGFEANLIDREMAGRLAKLKFWNTGMRLAFDRIEDDASFKSAAEELVRAGIASTDMLALVLFNFNDTPRQADYRMRVCRSFRIRPYPQRFQPLNQTRRRPRFVGKHWTERLVQAFRPFWMVTGRWVGGHTFESHVNRYGSALKLGPVDMAKWNIDADRWDRSSHQEMARKRKGLA